MIRTLIIVCLSLNIADWLCSGAKAEEVWLHDNTRHYGLIRQVSTAGKLVLALPQGQDIQIALEDVIAIRYLGRSSLLVQSGTQEFRLIDGSRIRGQIVSAQKDKIKIQSALAGDFDIDIARIRGFVSLPLVGFSGRKAEELVDSSQDKLSPSLDIVLDRRGSVYPGVLRKLDRAQLELDHEELLQIVSMKILYVAGVRFADAGRAQLPSDSNDNVQVRIWGRDDSVIQGKLTKIHLGKWQVIPSWNPSESLLLDVEEISRVQVLGGKVQYLSQLEPIKVAERSVLTPPQPYRIDQSCQGDTLRIAGKRYLWGLGVHADSELTYHLQGKYKEFKADIGLSDRQEKRGSVQFFILGDGKELFQSKVITAQESTPLEVHVPVQGVQRLTLKVYNAGDLDLGDSANWGGARLLR